MATDLRQTHFRFGKDDGTESTHTFWQAEDVNHSQQITADWILLLRFTEQEAGGTAAGNTDAIFQYNKNGAGWVDITTTSSVVKAVAVAAFTNGQACTKRLSGTGTFETTGAGCTEDGSSGGNANDIVASGNSETEAGLQIIYANVVSGDVIQFRFRSPDWTVTYTVTPSLTVLIPVVVIPGALALTLTMFAPTVLVSDNKIVIPGTLALTLTMYAPAVIVSGGGITVIPGTLALTLTMFVPTVLVSDNKLITPGTLALILTAFAPTIVVTNHITVTPGTVALILTAFAPTIIIGYNWTVVALVESLKVYCEAQTGGSVDTRRDITDEADQNQVIADMKAAYPTSTAYYKHHHNHDDGGNQPCVLESV